MIPTQTLTSVEADFEEMTWKFQLGPSTEVYAGDCAIMPVENYTKLLAKIDHAERLLRSLRQLKDLCDFDKERIDRFFDPEPL